MRRRRRRRNIFLRPRLLIYSSLVYHSFSLLFNPISILLFFFLSFLIYLPSIYLSIYLSLHDSLYLLSSIYLYTFIFTSLRFLSYLVFVLSCCLYFQTLAHCFLFQYLPILFTSNSIPSLPSVSMFMLKCTIRWPLQSQSTISFKLCS